MTWVPFAMARRSVACLVTSAAFLGLSLSLSVGVSDGAEYDPFERPGIVANHSRLREGEHAFGEQGQRWWKGKVTFAGDVRAALALNVRGGHEDDDRAEILPAIRIRGGVTVAYSPALSATARLALFLDKQTQGIGFRLDHARTIQPGDLTFDSLFLTLKPHEFVTVKIGRLQTQFEIDSVIRDSLSRNDSGGLGVTWTDGLHLTIGAPSSLRLHFIGQANPEEGPTNGVGGRGPVDFADGASRLTYYVALQAPPVATFTQLMADMTIIPKALRPQGLGTEQKDDLIALTMKAAADVAVRHLPTPLILHPFVEFGVMLATPLESAVGISTGESRAGPFALVGGVDLKRLGPGDLGFQCAWIQAGYLLSPDYPNDTWSVETRYKIGIARNAVLEVRYRHRQDLHRRTNALDLQTEDNILARITARF